jgi:hypothetical protein
MRSAAWLLLLVVVYFVGDRLGAAALGTMMWRSSLPYPKLYEGRYDADIFCIGNSRGVYGFPTTIMEEVTGEAVANLSVNGLAPQIAECMLLDYLDHCPPPRMVLAEANFVEMETSAAGVMKFSPYFSRSQRLFDLACRFDSTYSVLGRASKLTQFNSELTMFAAMHYAVHRGRSDEDALVRRQISPQLVADTETMEPISLDVNDAELAAVKRMADACRKRNIGFKLVLTGYLPAYRAKIQNLQAWMDEIESQSGLEVIDLSAIGANSAFFDRVHLNAEGSRRTAELIMERGLLN